MRQMISSLIVLSSILGTSTLLAAQEKKIDTTCSKDDGRAITIVIKKYLDAKGPITSDKAAILDKRCAGDYAVASIRPRGNLTDDAIVYLHKVKYQWGVIGLGTTFDADFLAPIPQELQQK